MERGLSNSNVRLQNRRKLTKLFYRQKGLTKQQIAFSMGLSLPTINLLVSQLEDEGLLERQSSKVSSGGRIPDMLCFKYDARQVVGVEIQKDCCRILLVNLAGAIKAEQYVEAEFNDSYTYKRGLRARILQMLNESNISLENVIGVGVTLPGIVEPGEKTIEYPSILELRHSNFDKLDIELGFPVFVENEAVNAD